MKFARMKIRVDGVVQGVGFRPFVYRTAIKENLKGFVTNSSRGVEIEVEGSDDGIRRFLHVLGHNAPPLARITRIHTASLEPEGSEEFIIDDTRQEEDLSTLISPDIGVCDDCVREMLDVNDRRFGYPFINCTNCGPRYTIIRRMPYDRPMTTMSCFPMCEACSREYRDPSNRRFHAQPNACAGCGPWVRLTDSRGEILESGDPLTEAVRRIRRGKIVAVKGLGGFHLACDARSEKAVSRLRRRKMREEKPFAVMVSDIEAANRYAEITPHEKDLLVCSRRPVVLMRKKHPFLLADPVAPHNQTVGLMLPCTPIQVLLMSKGLDALVMTSANLSDEPIAAGNREALERLNKIADFFLIANRDIHTRADDSVMHVVEQIPRFIRRSRGYVPMPVFLSHPVPPLLAAGGELKNTLCLTRGDAAFLSQHIGDLENLETLEYFHECRRHLMEVLQVDPQAIACDLHPDYLSTQWADEQKDLPVIKVQHHHAHIASCLAENGRNETVIGLAMDGTGYGEDGHVWGGEILLADTTNFRRVGHFQETRMPGGSMAVKQPWRMAAAYLWETWKEDHEHGEVPEFLLSCRDLPLFEYAGEEKLTAILGMLKNGIQTVPTSSLGRWFDGMAALTGIRMVSAFEGQAAMELEMAMPENGLPVRESGYSIPVERDGNGLILRHNTAVREVCRDIRSGVSPALMSLRFHLGLVGALERVCRLIREETGINTAALSGGCFQNRFLSARLEAGLKNADFDCLTHSQVPANDGGLSLGQAVVAANRLSGEK